LARVQPGRANEIKPQRDFVCIVGGTCQKPLIEAIRGEFIPVETCAGYLGSFAPFQVFESYAQMHHLYGRNSGHLPNGCDGRNFDAVIPGSYHLEDFPFNAKPTDYVVYVGRITERKGVAIAVEAARRAKIEIILCGQGDPVYTGPHAKYVGHINAAQRAAVMANAKAILVPSLYLEPFGGVNVEAQLCGTPAINSDWGAFPDGPSLLPVIGFNFGHVPRVAVVGMFSLYQLARLMMCECRSLTMIVRAFIPATSGKPPANATAMNLQLCSNSPGSAAFMRLDPKAGTRAVV
jgi:hypothetical protein